MVGGATPWARQRAGSVPAGVGVSEPWALLGRELSSREFALPAMGVRSSMMVGGDVMLCKGRVWGARAVCVERSQLSGQSAKSGALPEYLSAPVESWLPSSGSEGGTGRHHRNIVSI